MISDQVWAKICVDVRHLPLAEFEVYADLTEGGGDDEPPWRDIKITDIWSLEKHEPVSRRIYDYLMKEYEEHFMEVLSDEYDGFSHWL